MKQKSRVSVCVSLIAAALAMVLIICIACAMPYAVDFIYDANEFLCGYGVFLGCSYVGLLPVFIADILLILLLRLASDAEVFTCRAAKLLKAISLCCFTEIIPAFVLGYLMGNAIPSAIVSFICIFLGTVLLVVRDVIIRASEIKAENDYTV